MAPSLPVPALVVRDLNPEEAAKESNKFKSYYIIGIVIIVLLIMGVAAFFLVRRLKKKKSSFQEVSEDRKQALALNVRGIMLENDEKKSYAITLRKDEYIFDEHNMSESPIMPEVTVLSPSASKTEILEHYEAEGKLPRPFAPFMGTPPSPLSPEQKKSSRASTASWMSFNRNSFLSAVSPVSARSSVASFSSNSSGQDKRTVRQTFNPVLPDELVVSVGERFHIVTSYDDGWCIVGRDSVFKPGEVELGAVPAWCFVKPVKGLRAERPLRTVSLGVTINLQEPNSPVRDNVMSWSNF